MFQLMPCSDWSIPPDIAETYGVSDHREEKVQLPAPFFPLKLWSPGLNFKVIGKYSPVILIG